MPALLAAGVAAMLTPLAVAAAGPEPTSSVVANAGPESEASPDAGPTADVESRHGRVTDIEQSDDEQVEEGQELFATGCASCHGADGEGVDADDRGGAGGPSLVEAGEAGAYFQLSTGRMPAASSDEQPQRREPAYSPEEIDALVAYVASLGDGPALPHVDLADADLSEGGVLYRANCQACHSASGSGGALSYGSAAPDLGAATAEQIAAAVRVGPGQMPTFDDEIITEQELDDLVAYVRYLDNPEDPGGLPIGRTGPIPEGFVAWLVGMVAFVGLVVWIGTRAPLRRAGHDGATDDFGSDESGGSDDSGDTGGSGESGGTGGTGESGSGDPDRQGATSSEETEHP